jgi:hypothetical protein
MRAQEYRCGSRDQGSVMELTLDEELRSVFSPCPGSRWEKAPGLDRAKPFDIPRQVSTFGGG